MISRFFIERPVLSNVLALVFVLIGLVSLMRLPVSQYPNIVPPTVSVSTSYPGASAKTLIDTVALPIEQQVNGVEGMLYMQSWSASDGTYTLIVTFAIGTDPNMAQVLVQNRVNIALASLPTAVQAQGVTILQKGTSILEFVTLISPDGRYDGLFLNNYAIINIQNELERVYGVANVGVFGAGTYAMRIWMDPDRMQAFGLTPTDISNAIQKQSQEVTPGQLGIPPAPSNAAFQYTVNIKGRLDEAKDYENIIVKVDNSDGGRIVRIRDIGRVELGSQSYSKDFMQDNKPAAGIGIFQLPAANALQVSAQVALKMEELKKSFPEGLEYNIPFNTTWFVSASIDEVWKTLFEAALLVLVVILLFLQDWRATLVPATTVPVTIIGAFAAMDAMGFTINLSTLFAIILAIGIVVDDAIVIVEGVARHIEEGMDGQPAAEKAMDELFGPVVGITLVLMSVFLPASFIPGLTGQMFKQFALVIAATAFISAINAATLKPTQCALWLRKPVPPEKRNFIYRGFNTIYGKAEHWYAGLISRMVHHSKLMVIIAIALMSVAAYGLTRIPTAFLPIEDQGYFLAHVQLPDASNLNRTKQIVADVSDRVRKVPGVKTALGISGISVLDNSSTLSNAGVLYITLTPWDVRYATTGQDLLSLYNNLNKAVADVEEAEVLILVPPAIQGIGNAAGFTMQPQLRNGNFDYRLLEQITTTIVDKARAQSALSHVSSSFRAGAPQIEVEVNRIKAETLGVTVGQVFNTISSYLGSTYVNQINKFGNVFQVYVQAEAGYRVTPADLVGLKVRTPGGDMVPLGTLVDIKTVQGPPLISLYNLYPSSTVVGAESAGFSSGQALSLMEQIATSTLPPGAGFEWTAMSYQEKAVGNQIYYVFGLAILLVYFVLAGQYESWIQPMAVILAVPLALLGTVGALLGLGVANNLYTQIGLVLLIALASKNAILIVEYAREKRAEGMEIMDAAVEASRLRFRPILMTSFAFILGVLPLVFATGAGANSRKSIGIAVVSGMLASTCLAVLFVPSFYTVLQRFEEKLKGRKKKAGGLTPPEPDVPPAPASA
ncbi:efflux RND transporter permease subunit [Xanthobacter dioxanivorans]|uniref:Efflux pump membrane transporter n=1 Tax=Xanthobacter dioxanivorans TaxID=2528964 RepID=A0A974PT08_9HYPH|nr:efflux RND transporter permease subunit [Xanthobacter dioxanivorans]QRG09238.1 efflux RND transporter permease subunit [Xanthobacter dioxanivorans]